MIKKKGGPGIQSSDRLCILMPSSALLLRAVALASLALLVFPSSGSMRKTKVCHIDSVLYLVENMYSHTKYRFFSLFLSSTDIFGYYLGKF